MHKRTTIVSLALIIAAAGGYVLYASIIGDVTQDSGSTQACTEEAKLCPDGSTVGRTGPNCEFAACPSPEIIFGKKAEELCGPQPPAECGPGTALGCYTKSKKWSCYPEMTGFDTSDWKTYRSEEYGFEVRYPQQWYKHEAELFLFLTPTSPEVITESPGINFVLKPLEGRTIQQSEDTINFDRECQPTIFGGRGATKCHPVISFAGESFTFIRMSDGQYLSIGDYLTSDLSGLILSTFKFTK
ncbi:MAG: hypothetical protein Q8R39_01695 [bacterium]|nr:hypothetical protein [bacterium]MDZ4285171.1 hypothetical protein [Patescibacteria group bacterium]